MGSIVAIVGRPNVGKSTLYNRLIGGRDAIVDNVSGVTRDRKYGVCEWGRKRFTVIDTGGFVKNSEDVFEAAIRSQVRIAIDEAEVIVFMVDATTGLTDLDEEVAQILRRSKKPVILCVNKVDNHQRMLDGAEFYSLGFECVHFIASISGSGTGDLLDDVVKYVDEEPVTIPDIPKIAIVGQPNVGKSSLTNALLGEERNIVTDVAGTTRDPIHSRYNKFGKDFMLIDTAGIRKKAKVHEDLEFYSVMRAIRALEDSDVVILMIDAVAGMEAQDMQLFRLAKDRHKGIVILVNKWDLVANKETNTARDYEKVIKQRISPFDDVPIIFTSVHEKQRIFQAVEEAIHVHENRSRKIKTSELNEVIQEIVEQNPPPSYRGVFIKIKYASQIPLPYPSFVLFCNHPKQVRESYRNYVENQLRKRYDFRGVPMMVYFRDK